MFVKLHKYDCVITQTPFFRIRTQTLLVQHSGMLLPQYNAENVGLCGVYRGGETYLLYALMAKWVARGTECQEVVDSNLTREILNGQYI